MLAYPFEQHAATRLVKETRNRHIPEDFDRALVRFHRRKWTRLLIASASAVAHLLNLSTAAEERVTRTRHDVWTDS